MTCCTELSEINTVARILWRNGFSFLDRGTSVVVEEPVIRPGDDGQMLASVYEPRTISSVAEARQLIAARAVAQATNS